MDNTIDIGDEVLCIDSSYKPENKSSVFKNFPIWITEKEYIVRDVLMNDDIVVGILLEGVNNPPIWIPLLKRMQEPAFAHWRFVKKRTAYQIQEENEEIENTIKEENYIQ